MLWGKKDEELPQRLRGKTPEQIEQALADAEARETELTSVKTQAQKDADALAAANAERDSLTTKVADLEANATRRNDTKRDGEQEPTTLFGDPDKFVNERVGPTHAVALHAGKLAARMSARQSLTPRDNRIWGKYESEITQVVDGSQPTMQIMPQTWFNALVYVKGLHEQEIAKAERESSDFFSEVPTSRHQDEPEKKDVLSQQELDIARKMGITPERYMEQKKKMVVNSAF